jgi:ABC-type protease/lipase transport system fused ATPase/permease subunit
MASVFITAHQRTMKDSTNMFAIAMKSISFAWQTNRALLIILIFLNIFQGSVVYLQFTEGQSQHQRLAVARMFYRNAAITILDEPTASIDAVTEEKIFSSLEKNMEGKTVILITHRFSTVKNADKILMLEHGRIIEQGSQRELMKQNGQYAGLYTVQARRYLEDDDSAA